MSGLDWKHRIGNIPEGGLDVAREGSAEERAAVAAALDFLSCERLVARYRVQALDRGRFNVAGSFEADISQSCVVTLDPVASSFRESFAVEFWPEPTETGDALAADGPEYIENETLDIGAFIVDRLAVLIDPYPRKPGAEVSWNDERASKSGADSPFAALKNFRSKQ